MKARVIDTGTKELLCSVENNVATVSFNRAEQRNALGDIVTPALRKTLLKLGTDGDVRVIVITGVGKAFCAGGDIKGMGNRGNMSDDRTLDEKISDLRHRQNTLTLRLYELPKPTIAALPGAAAGAGMSIALACDIRIGTKNAFYASGYGLVGLSGDYGGSWQLTKLVGPAKAKEIYYTGRRIHADEALQLGLLNEVVEQDYLQTRTKELAIQIAKGPPIAIRYMKENINQATQADFKECLDWEADRLIRAAQTNDHEEAVRAFIEKRDPIFKGN
jgi:2-(1,2-epoxy-1,2-dihydrophenyl)acetyl-CoA isomerase|tara:strand:- start:242 stop:1066 length:825 start_codon:yes stop_codon:yes gene_type:complete